MLCKVTKDGVWPSPQSRLWPFPMMAERVTQWRVSDGELGSPGCWILVVSHQAAANPESSRATAGSLCCQQRGAQ